MSICIFPGTFNPVHNAHLRMAEFALENYKFEKIIFIPSHIPPHKDVSESLAFHRFNMVKLAVSHNQKFEVSDIEYNSSEPSYSFITVNKIKEEYKIAGKLNFIIGTDAFLNIETWKNPEELKKNVHFIVFPRRGYNDSISYQKLRAQGWDFELTPTEFIDISSTQIRKNLDIDLTSKNVEEYIKNYGLYKS